MPSLSAHANVWSTCLQILHRKGYLTHVELAAEDDGQDAYVAEKNGFNFAADNPIELLGLAAIYEEVQPLEDRPYWWTIRGDGPSVDSLLEEALGRRDARERELAELRLSSPETWAQTIRVAMNDSGGIADAATQLGISTTTLKQILTDALLQELRERSWR